MTASTSFRAASFSSAASALSAFAPAFARGASPEPAPPPRSRRVPTAIDRPLFELDGDAFVPTTARARSPSTPSRVGAYAVLTRLATGGMGDVLLAARESPSGFRRVVALKRLREEHSGDPLVRAMFLDEARLAARFRHPNLVTALDLVEDDASPYYTMPWLEGRTLAEIIDAAGACGVWPDASFFLHVIAQALEGLHHAHELRGDHGRALDVVHRDVSPHNVFVTYDGEVRLIDFGVAEFAGPMLESRRNVLAGKRGYISPEHVAGRAVDRRADVFSMGVILWETLARRAIGEPLQMTRAGRLAFSPPSSVARGVPARLDALAMRALEIDPAARFPSARAMADAIDAHVDRERVRLRPRDVGQVVTAYFHEERRRLVARSRANPDVPPEPRDSNIPIPLCVPLRAPPRASRRPLPRARTLDPNELATFLDRALSVGRIGVAMISLAIVLATLSMTAMAMNDPVTASLLRAAIGASAR